MADLTYNWDDVDSSIAKLQSFSDDTSLDAYPTPFSVTSGNPGDRVFNLCEELVDTKTKMTNLTDAFATFLSYVNLSFDDLEAEMCNIMQG